ncbi:hypothetical protein ASPZODRAFT_467228 [Penicilliopsis zonata CBS 506.65]|uniref:Aspergillopepsin n=1 Tax=Penicilliopsis zonata CBS 506.65 TaxID=1073090 RepID=A0A1L9SX84_9EURO|nr:hypothetical protein ASPZODRAFT_467228 [Penicilliopsis zonata CBS 506.65]OJJ51790.1 hypothetical protein ASPZODRAFT_467228 [Penicilliopsis zonata CBS 506.65]
MGSRFPIRHDSCHRHAPSAGCNRSSRAVENSFKFPLNLSFHDVIMKVSLTLSLLLGTAIAAPHKSTLQTRVDARIAARAQRGSQPAAREEIANANLLEKVGSAGTVEYSKNWAGAVREKPPSAAATYTAVTATFTVPEPTAAAGDSSSYQAASAWVGIDGDTYSNAILQTGVDFYIYEGEKYYDAWYEWYPDYAYDFSSLGIQAGDEIVAIVQATSASQGVAVIENRSSGVKATQTLSASAATATLGGQNAEWILEDFESNGTQVALADFNSVVFTGAVASTADGKTYGVSDATILEIKQNNKVLTQVTVDSDSELSIKYSG